MIQLRDRAAVFAEYPLIGVLVRDFQSLGFDPDVDDPEDEWCDAMLLPEVKLDIRNEILMLPCAVIQTYPQQLAKALIALLERLGCEQLVLLGHVKTNLFGDSKHTDPELLRVRSTLQALIGHASFQECIKLDLASVAPLLDIFFWLGRLDPELPEYVFWMDEGQRFCFFICRYGNIHWLSWHKQKHLEKKYFQELGFRLGADYDQFI